MNTDAPEITKVLYALLREHGSAYVLVDRLVQTPALDALELAATSTGAAWLPLTDSIFNEAPQRSPALLQLSFEREGDTDVLDRSVEMTLSEIDAGTRSLCGWLFFSGDAVRAQHVLSCRLDARFDGRHVYLRYFDPRVLPQLARLFDSRAGSDLLAPVTTWCLLARDGQWFRFDTPGNTLPNASLRLDASEASAVDRMQRINEAAAELTRWGHEAGHECDQSLDRAVQEAVRLGLTEAEDQTCYAAYACAHGTRFTAHPRLPRWLELTKKAGVPLGAVLAEPDIETSLTGTETTSS